jgi:hypothetical protein
MAHSNDSQSSVMGKQHVYNKDTGYSPAPPDFKGEAYPKWKYQKDGTSRVVNTPKEEQALGGGWYDTPKCAEPPKPAAPPVDK